MEHSPTIGAIAGALAAVQAELRGVPRDKTATIDTRKGGRYTYQYADLASVWSTIRATLATNGIAVYQAPETEDRRVTLTTMLLHSSGEWLRSTIAYPLPDEMTPQAVGSLVTYLRRYGLAAAVGVVTDDDDGQGAAHDEQPQRQTAPAAASVEQPAAEGRPATQKQYGFIHAWMRQWGMAEAETLAMLHDCGVRIPSFHGLTTRTASEVIDALKRCEPSDDAAGRAA